jgi:hypothetical protein
VRKKSMNIISGQGGLQKCDDVIPDTQEVETGRTAIHSQPQQKVGETPSQSISQAWWYTPIGCTTKVQAGPEEKHKTLFKK